MTAGHTSPGQPDQPRTALADRAGDVWAHVFGQPDLLQLVTLDGEVLVDGGPMHDRATVEDGHGPLWPILPRAAVSPQDGPAWGESVDSTRTDSGVRIDVPLIDTDGRSLPPLALTPGEADILGAMLTDAAQDAQNRPAQPGTPGTGRSGGTRPSGAVPGPACPSTTTDFDGRTVQCTRTDPHDGTANAADAHSCPGPDTANRETFHWTDDAADPDPDDALTQFAADGDVLGAIARVGRRIKAAEDERRRRAELQARERADRAEARVAELEAARARVRVVCSSWNTDAVRVRPTAITTPVLEALATLDDDAPTDDRGAGTTAVTITLDTSHWPAGTPLHDALVRGGYLPPDHPNSTSSTELHTAAREAQQRARALDRTEIWYSRGWEWQCDLCGAHDCELPDRAAAETDAVSHYREHHRRYV